ncbi:MAG: MFS transporter [Oscillospiraceae bacterium]|nr:MFS transporter [Oscillospiraceae bacterium]
MKEKLKLTPLERGWILYDIGNSAFILMVSTLIPIFFNTLAGNAGVDEDLYLSYWGYAGSIATILVAVIGPICGALSDRNFKKPIFVACVILGALGCAALGFVSHWLVFLGVFIVAKVGFSASIVFYDSMLPEITGEDRMDKISSMGYAYGYIGSVIPFVVCLLLVLMPDLFGLTMGTAMIVAFTLIAVWWIVCTLPLLKHYKQTAFVAAEKSPVGDTFRQLARTLREVRKEKHIFLYLLAFFFFIDGVYTIIDMATAYGTALGLDTTGLLLALLLTQVVAFPCAILFGRLSAKYDTGLLIKVCIIAYTLITLFAVFLMTQWQFWVLATLVGMFQGGIQALSRSYLGKIIPAERSGEFYGLMDICGKGASFVGLSVVSVVSQLTAGMTVDVFGLTLQNENIAVCSLIVLFAIGYVLFCKADKLNRERVK